MSTETTRHCRRGHEKRPGYPYCHACKAAAERNRYWVNPEAERKRKTPATASETPNRSIPTVNLIRPRPYEPEQRTFMPNLAASVECEHKYAVLDETATYMECYECDQRIDPGTFEIIPFYEYMDPDGTDLAEQRYIHERNALEAGESNAPKSVGPAKRKPGRPPKAGVQEGSGGNDHAPVRTSELQQQVEAMAAEPYRGASVSNIASAPSNRAANKAAGKSTPAAQEVVSTDRGPMDQYPCPTLFHSDAGVARCEKALSFTKCLPAKDGNSYFYKCHDCGTVVSVMEER